MNKQNPFRQAHSWGGEMDPSSKRASFLTDVENYLDGEEVIAICLDDFAQEASSWENVKDVLDYPYDPGYGFMDVHNIMIWTPTRVIYVHEYDGSTSLRSVPRNPPPIFG